MTTSLDTSQATAPAPGAPGAARRRNWLLRAKKRQKHYLTALSFCLALGIWELVARVIVHNQLFFPTVEDVIRRFGSLWQSGDLQQDILISGKEVLLGYVLGAVAGILIGGVMSSSRALDALVAPWVTLLYSMPTIALAPLFIIWLGVGISSKVAVVFLMVIFPVLLNTRQGMSTTEQAYVDVAHSFAATELQFFRKVKLPAAVPYVLVGLRLAVPRGLVGMVVGEMFGASAGLGYLIINASQVFDSAGIFVAVVVISAEALILTALLHYAEKVAAPWRFLTE